MNKLEIINDLNIKVAGICIGLRTKDNLPISLLAERKRLLAFRSKAKPDYILNVTNIRVRKLFPKLRIEKSLFKTGTNWTLYRRKDKKLLWLDTAFLRQGWERLLITDNDFTQGRLYLLSDQKNTQAVFDPLSYPVDQFLMVNLLGKKKGIMVHSCGVDHNGQGLLFVGSSGAGKTTLADLWVKHEAKCRILNDDRIVLRSNAKNVTMFGTPWHGTGHYTDNHKVLLKKIFFIQHSKTNYIKKLDQQQTTLRLISALFPAFWDKPAMKFSLDLSADISRKISAYELGVVPNKSIIKFLTERSCG